MYLHSQGRLGAAGCSGLHNSSREASTTAVSIGMVATSDYSKTRSSIHETKSIQGRTQDPSTDADLQNHAPHKWLPNNRLQNPFTGLLTAEAIVSIKHMSGLPHCCSRQVIACSELPLQNTQSAQLQIPNHTCKSLQHLMHAHAVNRRDIAAAYVDNHLNHDPF
jgi:hypothetical protein